MGGGGTGTYGYSQGAAILQVHLTATVKRTRFEECRMMPEGVLKLGR